jgi:hypothetical protein
MTPQAATNRRQRYQPRLLLSEGIQPCIGYSASAMSQEITRI